jgi:AcrR family transcriptional regulator
VTSPEPNRSDTRSRIIHATYELVAESGLGSVTMTSIADRAHVARQTLYNHFTDVEQIVIAGIEGYDTTGFAHLLELLAATETAEAKLDLLVRHSVVGTSHRHLVADLRIALSADGRRHLDQHVVSFRSLIGLILAEGVEDGSFDRSLDPETYAVLVEGLLLAAGDLATEDDNPAAAASVASEAIMRMLGTGRGERRTPG